MRTRDIIMATATGVCLILWLRQRRGKSGGQSLDNPVAPVKGRVSQGYSASHRGVDIAVPTGTEVRCPWDGTVTKVWFDDVYGGGRSMLIKHDNGYTSGYAHLEGYHVGSGDRVLQGQNIALSGNTGSHTTGPHLHFTIRNKADEKVDPQTIINFNT